MRTRRTLAVVAALSSLLSSPTAPAAAQWINFPTPGVPRLPDGKPDLSASVPRTAEGRPDLSGIWRSGGPRSRYDYDVAQNLKPEDIQPWAEALRLQRVQDFRKDSPLARCLPVSLPFLNSRGLARIVQTPGLIVVLHESPNSPHRTIFTDGRALPKDPNPTWLGYSVGHWEGDTLVVESAGFNDRGWLDVGGHPQTESTRVTERFRRRDFGHMELDMTINDPKTFTKPVSMRMENVLEPDTVLLEDVCENERDSSHLERGVRLAPEILSRYAGSYEFAPGRAVVVTIGGDLLFAQEGANAKLAFVPRSDTSFLASVTNDAIEFVKDSEGAVTHLIWRGRGKDEKAVRKGSAGRDDKK
jgi:hypothetical protein